MKWTLNWFEKSEWKHWFLVMFVYYFIDDCTCFNIVFLTFPTGFRALLIWAQFILFCSLCFVFLTRWQNGESMRSFQDILGTAFVSAVSNAMWNIHFFRLCGWAMRFEKKKVCIFEILYTLFAKSLCNSINDFIYVCCETLI